MQTSPQSKVIVQSFRLKTLPASLSPVILGSLWVPLQHLDWVLLALSFSCALWLQIAVNLCNDYFDAKTGVDTDQRLGPVRVTQSGLLTPNQVKGLIAAALMLALISGLALSLLSDYRLLYIGVFCLLAVLAYSGGPLPLASLGLGEFAVLVFFGWVAVMGSYYVHTLDFSWSLFLLSNALGLTLSAIMLVNNTRDIITDRAAGKITLSVRLGEKRSSILFGAMLSATLVLHLWVFTPLNTLIASISALLFWVPAVMVWRRFCHASGAQYNSVLAQTSLLGLWYSVIAGASGFLVN